MNCPYAKTCGACSLLDTDYEAQLAEKLARVRALLKPYCAVDGILGMETPYHYRCKVTATFAADRRQGLICGRYAEGTRTVVPVEDCLIEDERADAILRTIRDLARSFRLQPYDPARGTGVLRHVLIRVGRASGQILVALVTGSAVFPSRGNFVRALLRAHPEITTVVQSVNGGRTGMILGERTAALCGPGTIEDTLCGKRFRISPQSFFQVNPLQTERLYASALEFAALSGTETAVDAYCGIGTIALSASGHAGRVIGVESNPAAVRDAEFNRKLNGAANVSFVRADAAEYMAGLAASGARADVVFTDPPRAGCGRDFVSAVGRLAPGRVVYVSCNPVTLADDLGALSRAGYRALRARAVDMFPHTAHVETVVLMSRVEGK